MSLSIEPATINKLLEEHGGGSETMVGGFSYYRPVLGLFQVHFVLVDEETIVVLKLGFFSREIQEVQRYSVGQLRQLKLRKNALHTTVVMLPGEGKKLTFRFQTVLMGLGENQRNTLEMFEKIQAQRKK